MRCHIPTASRGNGIVTISENIEYPSDAPQLSNNTNCRAIEMSEDDPPSYDEAAKTGIL